MLNQLSDSAVRKLFICLAVYLVALFSANTLGVKIMPFVFGTHLSVAVFSFPIVFMMTDVIGEVYGRKFARLFVLCGFIATLLFIGYSFLSIAMPWSEAAQWVHASYNTVFGLSIRIAIASVIAFIVGEYQDVFAFFFVRDRWENKGFWLRANLSNVWSQLLDSTLFMVIAFYGVYDTKVLISIILTWWLYKVAIGILCTPLSYLGIYLLREKQA
ncbi:queuosine precursor transporter [Candidatus Kaiserbacteria bacterium]|nr:queuosine precursor transporter [Candidatus Kaiserbacteria bacterium]